MLDLSRGQADLAIRLGTAPREGGAGHRLGDRVLGMYASMDYLSRRGTPAHVRDVEGHDFVGYEQSVAYRPPARWLDSLVTPSRYTFCGNSTLLIAAAAASGLGLAVIPCFVGETEPSLRRVGTEVITSIPLWLVVHGDAERLARIRAVHAELEAVFSARAHVFGGPPLPA